MTERAWKGHALWLVGFRPFFPLACAVAVVAPVLWVLMLAGVVSPPSGLQPQQWHAHEMFYGFGLAVLGGFLLTATKNWVQVRGHHGRALQVLVAAWLFERVTLWWGGAWPAWLRWVGLEAYGVLLVLLVSWTLVRGRKQDSYRDNFYFIVALPVFLAARALLLSASYFAQGHAVTLALFRLAFVVMLERTLTQFMKAAFQVALPRVAVLDGGIKVLALTLVAGPWLPGLVRPTVEVALAVLVTARFLSWSPHLAFQRIELGVMYVGALALALQLVLDAFPLTWVGALPTHVFTFGTMGLIIPAMFTRIAHGHTGRPGALRGCRSRGAVADGAGLRRARGGAAGVAWRVSRADVARRRVLGVGLRGGGRAHHAAGARGARRRARALSASLPQGRGIAARIAALRTDGL